MSAIRILLKLLQSVIAILLIISCTRKIDKVELDNSIQVHYIANEGFLIENNDRKVLIDALLYTGLDRYACPDSILISDMILGEPPFEWIDYLFFTHNHPDHFNDSLALAFMAKHHETTMVCPSQVHSQLHKNQGPDENIEERIITITPDSGQIQSYSFDNLDIKICRTRHADTYDIENNAYILDFGEVKVFHSGDSWREALDDWQDFDIKAEKINLAMVNGFYAGDGYRLLNEKMDPEQIIMIHVKNEQLDLFTDIMAKDTAVFKNSTLFKIPLELKTYRF